MPIIHVLDETTINKIAAGEVVERPASVIKELVENSIDAGASSIEIEIADGGTSYMRITDNGCGMSEEDARLAVLRHATSKIQQVEDLFDIASLGFRGEAIASIASVSHFSLVTRQLDNEMGTRITIDGGQMQDCMPYGAQPGTTIEVRDLFYNTPARRKFLKTERTEGAKIQDIIGKLAVSHTHIAFKLIVDDKISIVTPGNGKLTDAVAALYGYKVTDDVFPIAYEAEGIVVEGIVSKPTLLKSSRLWQTTIVNNRVISDKAINKAIDNAYHALLPKGGYPLVILTIVVPPESVDINVHPRKSEVKFADDKPIFRAVYHAVLQALETPLQGQVESREETIATAVDYDKVFTGRNQGYEIVKEKTTDFVNKIKSGKYEPPKRIIYEQSQLGVEDSIDAYTVSKPMESTETNSFINAVEMQTNTVNEPKRVIQNSGLIPLGQVASCYIVAKKGEDLYIIDQHAAHERVRYDKLCKSADSIPMQSLLMPIYMSATADEMALVEEGKTALLDLGFEVDLGGPSQLRIDSIPVDIVESKAEEVVRFIFTFLHESQQPTKAQLRHEMLAYASCRGAIKAGHELNMYQMAVLIEDLFTTDKPYVCPHGRPTIIKFSPDELGKLFLRS